MASINVGESLRNASSTEKAILVSLALLAAAAAAYFGLIAPKRAGIADLANRQAALQRELTHARAAASDLERYRRETAELARRLDTVKEKLPTDREIPPLYRTLYQAAADTRLAVSLFQPNTARVQEYYTEIPIAVTAEGNYHQLGAFFEQVARLPRVVTIGDLKLTGLGRPRNVIRADMVLATYIYRPVGSPPPPPKPPGTPASAAPRAQHPLVGPQDG